MEQLKEMNHDAREKMLAADKEAREAIDGDINKAYYASEKFAKNLATSSAFEGAKMGFQQAFGLLCYDLFNALFDEVLDIWRNNLIDAESSTWFESVKRRLLRVGEKIVGNWKNLIASFRDGFFSAIFSNLLTILVNTFMTTLKNMIRIIREGTMVLYRTVKSIVFPQPGKSWREILDEALKVFVAGSITVGGIALEEAVSNLFVAIPGGSILTGICAGLATGILTAIAMYVLDILDPFGVKDEKRKEMFYDLLRQDEQMLLEFQNDITKYCSSL